MAEYIVKSLQELQDISDKIVLPVELFAAYSLERFGKKTVESKSFLAEEVQYLLNISPLTEVKIKEINKLKNIEEIKQQEGFPKIVCLCGSTRFYNEFQKANYEETMKGNIVLSVGFYPHASKQVHGEEIGCTPEQKKNLDKLHFRKIDLADEVLILNVEGYIGESTKNELQYAKSNNKVIRFLESN